MAGPDWYQSAGRAGGGRWPGRRAGTGERDEVRHPLREGGSLPALVEADNLGTYVLKFRGAGQGPKALVAEIIGGELARRLGLRTPELALGYLDPRIASSEPDPEIQDLLRASSGQNVAVDFLPGSAGFDPAGGRPTRTSPASSSGSTR